MAVVIRTPDALYWYQHDRALEAGKCQCGREIEDMIDGETTPAHFPECRRCHYGPEDEPGDKPLATK